MSDDEAVRYWDTEADTFDDAVDHGLRDPVARDRWRTLLGTAVAQPAARIAARIADPPLVAGGFDVVLSRHVLWAMPDVGQTLDRWLALLAPGGALVLVEGRWWTGGGLAAEDAVRLVSERGREAVVSLLPDPALWGGPISDERYLLVSAR